MSYDLPTAGQLLLLHVSGTCLAGVQGSTFTASIVLFCSIGWHRSTEAYHCVLPGWVGNDSCLASFLFGDYNSGFLPLIICTEFSTRSQ